MLGIGNGSSRLGIGNVGVQSKFVAWNWKWRRSSHFRSLESEMEEFEPSSRLEIGNAGVRVQFRRWESGMEEFEKSSMLGIGNERVRVKFQCLESGMEVLSLESGM